MTAAAARRFRPGWPLTLVTAAVLAVLVTLGTWQVQRLGWKLDLIARIEAGLAASPVDLPAAAASLEELDQRPVTARGTLRHDLALALGSVQKGGIPGARLLVPLVRDQGVPVLVDLGWIPEPVGDYLAAHATPEPVVLDAILRADHPASQPPFRPANDAAGRRWHWLDTAALRTTLGLPDLAPVTLVRVPAGPETAPPLADPPRVTLTNNHLGYAITWYGLGAALLAVYVTFGFARGRETTP